MIDDFQLGWNHAGKGLDPKDNMSDDYYAGYDSYIESHADLDGLWAS